jgi:CRP-like cAMP-binding protein
MNDFVAGNQLLQRLAPEDRAALEPHLVPVSFEAGEVLFEPEQPLTHLYFVHTGAISVVVVLESGVTVEALFVGREGMIGCFAAFSPARSVSRIITQVAGTAARLEVGRARALVAERPAFAAMLDNHRNHVMTELLQATACNAVHRVGQRLAKWLLRCRDRVDTDVLPLTQDLLSQMLGVQRTTVTQAAGELQRAGLIDYRRGRLQVLDRAGLERAACECYGVVRARELLPFDKPEAPRSRTRVQPAPPADRLQALPI